MKNKMINEVNVSGWVFNHELRERTSKNGQLYISGRVNIATDRECVSIVPVNFIFITPEYKSGKSNPNYSTLSNLIESNATVEAVGIENATMLRISGDISVNDFVNNSDEMVSSMQVRGGFVHVVNGASQLPSPEKAATFSADFLCNQVQEREFDDESFLTLSGYVFNFRNDFIPVSFNVRTPAGIDYFQGLDISNSEPYFSKVWGNIVNTTVRRENTVESAFGEPEVSFTEFSRRSWDIAGAAVDAYPVGSEEEIGSNEGITFEEIKKGLTKRRADLDDVRKRHGDYVASRNGGGSSAFAAPAPKKQEKKSESPFDDDFEF